jgi:hypothetical protein
MLQSKVSSDQLPDTQCAVTTPSWLSGMNWPLPTYRSSTEVAWRSLGSTRSECPDAVFPQYAPQWSPSPGGEGWGEGESGLTHTMSRGQCLNAPWALGNERE